MTSKTKRTNPFPKLCYYSWYLGHFHHEPSRLDVGQSYLIYSGKPLPGQYTSALLHDSSRTNGDTHHSKLSSRFRLSLIMNKFSYPQTGVMSQLPPRPKSSMMWDNPTWSLLQASNKRRAGGQAAEFRNSAASWPSGEAGEARHQLIARLEQTSRFWDLIRTPSHCRVVGGGWR